jgi:hypothetical protein
MTLLNRLLPLLVVAPLLAACGTIAVTTSPNQAIAKGSRHPAFRRTCISEPLRAIA